ncbi:MAG: F0F1 ATP synthase subunit epsilon [Planctomycetes bacterium]|nr:F0F1 ATP synthase subunit epsilon [Planctomycetota bacterium]
MASSEDKRFRCTVITPTGRVLDCDATDVQIPAHDGQLGIQYNRLPIFCRLGLGFMTVREVSPESQEHRLVIDGGFGLLARNALTVIAYDAISKADTEASEYEAMMARLERQVEAAEGNQVRLRAQSKLEFVKRLAGGD